MKNEKLKRMILIAMLCALAYVVMLVGRVPITTLDFLKYDPKDVVIMLGGFLLGPLAAFVISAVVSLVEMFTVSTTGVIGLFMNILSSCAFVCTAAFIYKKKKTLLGAIIGLVCGAVLMTAVMLLWNYLITPIYLHYPREEVAKLLIPIFLPFNLIKAGLNAGITLLLYKPVVGALRRAKLIPPSESEKGGKYFATLAISLVVIATFAVFALVLKGII